MIARATSGISVAPRRRESLDCAFVGLSAEVAMTPEPALNKEEVLRRVKGEFLEMPGLRLTEPQARRLWGLDRDSCAALLGALVEANFLFQTRDGAFMRVEPSTPIRATLRSHRDKIAAA